MRKLKPEIKNIVASVLVSSVALFGTYTISKAVENKTSENVEAIKQTFSVEQVDGDTVKVCLDGMTESVKAVEFSIILDENIKLNNVRALLDDNIVSYTTNNNEVKILVTSIEGLKQIGNKVELVKLDIAPKDDKSNLDFEIKPSQSNFVYVNSNNIEDTIENLESNTDLLNYNKDNIKVDDGEGSGETPSTPDGGDNQTPETPGGENNQTPEVKPPIQVEGVTITGGDGSSIDKPSIITIENNKGLNNVINEIKTNFDYEVQSQRTEGNYKIYKLKLKKKQQALRNTDNYIYVELKVDINNTDFIQTLEKELNINTSTPPSNNGTGGGIIYPDSGNNDNSSSNEQSKPQQKPENKPEASKPVITDVPDTYWAKYHIDKFIQAGYINGYEDNTFRPNNQTTRAEFIKLVNKVFNFTEKGTENFKDVSETNWFYNDILIAVKAGYINGYEDNTFRPNEPITRQEACKILATVLNAKGDGKLNFTDSENVSNWAKQYVDALEDMNIINGYEDKTFKPKNNITRAETVKILDVSTQKK